MKLQCERKNVSFDASSEQREWLETARAKGMPTAIIECPLCGLSHSISLSGEATTPDFEKRYPCPGPVGSCDGLVVYVAEGLEPDGGSFWGCGHCGFVWATEKEIQTATASKLS